VRCDFADSVLQGYFDGELSAPSAAEFERHLQQCVHCAVELVDLDLLSGRLQLAQLYETAPASLRKKIRANLRPIAPTTAMPQPLLWHWLAAAAALVLLAIAGWRVSPVLRTDDYQVELAEEIVDAHVHSLQPGHLTGISSNDEQAVKGWFKGKLTFALPVRDFANDGFALQGGRLDVVEGRSVAVLVYARPNHLFNVFIWPTRERDTSPRLGSRQGYQWIDWRKGRVEFCAVSEAPTSDLQQLQRLLTKRSDK
jgi:anti-sigma factor RsiW